MAHRIATYLRESVTARERKTMTSLLDQEGAGNRPRGGIPRLKPGYAPFLSYGFRPFFLGAGVWACAAMVLWIGLMSGGQVEITKGVNEGDIVVARAGALLREGDPVRPVMASAETK